MRKAAGPFVNLDERTLRALAPDPCRPGSGIAVALAEVEAREGWYYDAAVVEAALRLFREKGFSF